MTLDPEWHEFARAVADRYTVTSELGRGGMAVVLLAHDVRHGRDLALKLYRPALSAVMAGERFEREILLAARLNHPHIVPLFDSGAAAGYLYYVMPFVRGETMRQRLEREGALDISLAVRLAIEVCSALDYAHRDGVVHRDIKPENVLLSEGHALVADFGIAYAVNQAAGTRLTTMGLALGTPAYMSPEQASGETDIDSRSDQYSLACVLFELLTNAAPFHGPTAMAYFAQHVTQPAPSVTDLRPDVPVHVERALLRALEKDPADRFASTQAFAQALDVATVVVPTEDRGDSVVVLDFLNISGDVTMQWLAGGIAETIAVDLSRVGSVRVVRRDRLARALALRSHPVVSEADALQIAKAVGARWVVWGAYQAAGDRIRITPRFGNVSAESMRSSPKLDGAMREVFDLQDRIVDDVLRQLNVEVTEQQRALIEKPATNSLTAYELFARARQLQQQFTPAALLESRALLLEAVQRDPEYALAHSGLGYAYAFGFIGSSNPSDLASALVHLERATALDAGLGEAFAWKSYALGRSARFAEAVSAGEHAVALDPDSPYSHYFLALALYGASELGAGHWDFRGRAVRALHAAVSVEPGYQANYHVLADFYMSNGQYDDASVPIGKALDIEFGSRRSGIAFIGALLLDAVLALRCGDLARASTQFAASIARYSASTHLYAQVHLAQAHRGSGEVARRMGRHDDAVISAQQAIQICRDHPQQVGTGFTLVRAHALAAKANRALGVNSEARFHLAEAESLLATRSGFVFLPLTEANEGAAAVDCASVYAVFGKHAIAMSWLERAWNTCWNDYPLLLNQPDFDRMRDMPEFTAFVERCRHRSRHPAPGLSCEGLPS